MKLETLLIDLDGTLIETNHFYHLPQLKCAEILYHEFLHNSPRIEDIFASTDSIRKSIQNNSTDMPTDHFEQSWVQYYERLCRINNMIPKDSVKHSLIDTSAKYVQDTYQMLDGVSDVLDNIKQHKILVTLGSLPIQTRKIETATINKHVDDIEIVSHKNQKTYQTIIDKYGIDPKRTAMVGDNWKLDILPALKCGLHAFHVLGKYQQPKVDVAFPEMIEDYYTPILSFLEIADLLT